MEWIEVNEMDPETDPKMNATMDPKIDPKMDLNEPQNGSLNGSLGAPEKHKNHLFPLVFYAHAVLPKGPRNGFKISIIWGRTGSKTGPKGDRNPPNS